MRNIHKGWKQNKEQRVWSLLEQRLLGTLWFFLRKKGSKLTTSAGICELSWWLCSTAAVLHIQVLHKQNLKDTETSLSKTAFMKNIDIWSIFLLYRWKALVSPSKCQVQASFEFDSFQKLCLNQHRDEMKNPTLEQRCVLHQCPYSSAVKNTIWICVLLQKSVSLKTELLMLLTVLSLWSRHEKRNYIA